jgi:hypothetical protein
VREALNNVVKHAHARSVILSLRLADGMLEIDVDDDGTGFDLARPTADAEHDGLDNMRQRMSEIGGTCAIETAPGRGTRVRFRLPWLTEPNPGALAHA